MSSRLSIYFAGSIRGGREDAALYREIINYLATLGVVLTEHVGLESLSSSGEARTEEFIYQRDLAWIRKCDIMVAEVTQPSLGVGYELGIAEALGKPILCLFRPSSGRSLSAMVRGNAGITVKNYENLEEACRLIDAAVTDPAALTHHKTPIEQLLVLGPAPELA